MTRLFATSVPALAVLLVCAVQAPAQRATTCRTDVIEATGEVDFGGGLTKEQAEQMARKKAEREAVLKACPPEISSVRSVMNNEMIVDLIKSARSGVPVETKTIASEMVVDKVERDGVRTSVERYRVTIRTRFAALSGDEDPGFEVWIVGMKPSYVEGDLLTVGVQATADCYVHLFTIAADRSVTVFFPNKYRRDSFLRKGETLQFPDKNDESRGIRFRMGFLPGIESPRVAETVTVIATKRNIDLVGGTDIQEALEKVYKQGETGLIDRLMEKVVQLRGSEVAQALASYEVYRKGSR
jgi:hypothetical protein